MLAGLADLCVGQGGLDLFRVPIMVDFYLLNLLIGKLLAG